MSSKSNNSDSETEFYESISENGSMNSVSPTQLKNIENKAKLIETKTEYVYDSDCLRKKSNWSKSGNAYKFDHPEFDPKTLKKDIPSHSSKLAVLLKKIKDLDKKDMEKDGRHYKHFIFSDVKTSSHGAKLIASALLAEDMTLAYTAELKKTAQKEGSKVDMQGGKDVPKKIYKKIELLSDDVLKQTSGNNFYLLTSIGVYDQPITVTLKKSIFKKFNERPDNIHGELARFIIMDSGYKEGVDLFDIKYIHIFEPSINMADQRQTIGRGTRTCGQKGLEFHPTQGWPLHVFIYDVEIPEQLRYQTYGTETLFDLYLKSMNIDLRLINFQHDLERATIYGSVDYDLNRPIHTFVVSGNIEGGNPSTVSKKRIIIREDLPVLNLPEQASELTFPPRDPNAQPMGHAAMREYVKRHFSGFKWEDVKMENNCIAKTGGSEIVNYTPTQNFVRHFFTPEIPLKGMLLYHSPGTGKTCSAIATASSSFEQKGYTILWVTRTTLKSDIWKNMFDQICSKTIQERLQNNEIDVDKSTHAKRMRMLSTAWSIRPMSYKQFSNMILKSNALYKALIKKNGEVDPLRKTLLIIDEAHKLYGGTDLSSIERPDMKVLESAIQQSYEISGMDSVKVLLMTATPITQDPIELVKLINLMKPSQYQLPSEFDDFARKFLDEHGRFTPEGEKMYLDSIAGHVSYLNREKDARQFAQPIIKYIKTPLIDVDDAMRYDNAYARAMMDSDILSIRQKIEEENKKIDEEIKDTKAADFDYLKEKCAEFDVAKTQKECNKIVKENIREIVKGVKESMKDVKEKVNELKEQISFKKELKKDFIENIKKNIESETTDYENYKQSLYYSIKKCGKKITNMEELRAAVKDHPAIVEFDNQIREVDEKLVNMNQNLQNTLLAYKKRIADLKNLAKEDLSQLEKNVVNLVLKDERRTMKKRSGDLEKEHAENIGAVNKTRKAIEKKKRKKLMGIRKTMRQMVSEEKRVAKEIAKEERRLKRTQRKQANMISDFKNDFINELANKYTKIIEHELERLRETDKQRKEEEAEKQAKKEQNKIFAEKRAEERLKRAEERQKKADEKKK
jgi:hypothetical protein